jgi:hypothetical protein
MTKHTLKRLMRLRRKNELHPIALELKINPTKYKNKDILSKTIILMEELHLENDSDPITLEPLASIPRNRLITWEQHGKHYGADVFSLKNMIDRGNTINPWSIDIDTGVAFAENREQYLAKHDLTNVDGLLQKIETLVQSLPIQQVSDDNIPEKVVQRHSIEDSAHPLYISHIIDYFEDCKTVETTCKILCTALNHVKYKLAHHMHATSNAEFNHIDTLFVLDQYITGLFHDQQEYTNSLEYLYKHNSMLVTLFPEEIHKALFDSLENIIKEIKS